MTPLENGKENTENSTSVKFKGKFEFRLVLYDIINKVNNI